MDTVESFGYTNPVEALKASGYKGKGANVLKTPIEVIKKQYTHTNMIKPEGCKFWYSFEHIETHGKFLLYFSIMNNSFISRKV